MTETIKPAYLTRAAAAEYLSVSPRTISRLRKSGVLPVHEISGVSGYRYAVSDLDAAVKRNTGTVYFKAVAETAQFVHDTFAGPAASCTDPACERRP
jgi:excisionase family DNA binding protein